MSATMLDPMEERLTGRLAGRLAGQVQARGRPWAAQVVSWLDLVDLCLELDDALLGAEAPRGDALALHDTVLSRAIESGCWLVQQLREASADISAAGCTLVTLTASLELLRILHRSRHPQFPLDQLEVVRNRVFNAPA